MGSISAMKRYNQIRLKTKNKRIKNKCYKNMIRLAGVDNEGFINYAKVANVIRGKY